jgi:hypothetical protein
MSAQLRAWVAADPRFDFTTLIATYPILTQANAIGGN